MYCRKCGQLLPSTKVTCTRCGAAVVTGSNQGSAQERKTVAQEAPTKKHTLRTVLIIAGCVMVVGAVLAFFLINAGLNERHQQACDLMDSGDIAEAKAIFVELGAFKDAKGLAEECQSLIDYDAAKQKMDEGNYEEAKQAFAALGSFEDADKMAQNCQNSIDYSSAVLLKEKGDLEKAKDSFAALDDFQDAEQMAQDCQNQLDYNAAAALLENGEYEKAKQVFDRLDVFLDSMALSVQCQNHIDYSAAETALNNGEYYEAYELFSALGGFSGADERVLDCVQPNPKNGELYRNPDFKSKSCSVTIKVGDTGESLYLKIYTADDVLVSTVFVTSGQKTKIKLPSGSYRMKAAYGVEWFGKTDMFGNAGYYEVLIFEDGTDIDTLSSKYIYTLSFLQQEDGNVGGMNVGPDGF